MRRALPRPGSPPACHPDVLSAAHQSLQGRVTVHQLSSCMKNKCNQIGITPKGINAYRRTVNSLIRANGLSAEAAGAMIGNTPSVNNQYYTFDVTEDSKKYDVLDQVNQFMLNPGGSPGRSR